MYSIVDDEDYARVSLYEWRLTTKGYVVRCGSTEDETVSLHNFVLGLPPSSGVDHINLNKLDNYRQNLRLTTNSGNGQNRTKFSNNTSGFKGVSFHAGKGKFGASIKINYKALHLGYFSSKEDAARAYDEAAIKHFGPLAFTNFPKGNL